MKLATANAFISNYQMDIIMMNTTVIWAETVQTRGWFMSVFLLAVLAVSYWV